jgi:hypothetical protein
MSALDKEHPIQGEEPEASGDEPGDGSVWMISNFLSNLLTAGVFGLALSSPFKGSV